jgi:endonuclease/exonuclease/phosphatase family metal-dependent hydrolase
MAVHGKSTLDRSRNETVRVMTYNIRHGRGNDDRVDLGRIAEVIRSNNPEVVALQEVDRFWTRSGNVDQPAELARLLDMHACFAPNLDLTSRSPIDRPCQYGVLMLSKSPILSWSHFRFPAADGWEPRGLLEARIDVPMFGEIAVLATHFQAGPPDREQEAKRQRAEQARLTAERVRALRCPVIVMGDLNAGPDDLEPASLPGEAALSDAWAVAGSGSGYTFAASPDVPAQSRIDFILVSAEFTVAQVQVPIDPGTRMASDHYPVIADLRFAQSQGSAT